MPPKWVNEPEDIKLGNDAEIAVECKADGIPKPNVSWKSDAGDIFRGEILRIARRSFQATTYECIAENGVGPPLRKKIRVLINGRSLFLSS